MTEREGINEKHEKDHGYDPFKESENDDNRDVIAENEDKEEDKNKDKN